MTTGRVGRQCLAKGSPGLNFPSDRDLIVAAELQKRMRRATNGILDLEYFFGRDHEYFRRPDKTVSSLPLTLSLKRYGRWS